MEKDEELDEESNFLNSIKQTKSNLAEVQKIWTGIDVNSRIIKENIDRGIQNINWMETVHAKVNNDQINQAGRFFEEKIYPKIRGIVDYSQETLDYSIELKKDSQFMAAQTSGATAEIGSGAAYISTYLEDHQNETIYKPIVNEVNLYSPVFKRDVLKDKIRIINKKLEEMLNSAWDLILSSGIRRGEIYPAHAIRELLSEFLQALDPNDDVIKMKWCLFSKKNRKGKPTQRARVVYAILGMNEEFSWEDDRFKPIIQIANKYRELMKKVQSKVHLRSEQISEDLKSKLRNYIKLSENYIEEILRLRDIYQQ